MQDIIIYGAHGFGCEVACLINDISKETDNKWNLVGFIDDNIKAGTPVSHFGTVLGNIDFLNKYPQKIAVAFALGYPQVRHSVYTKIDNRNLYFPNLVSPDIKVYDTTTFTLGQGNIIFGNSIVTYNVKLGNFNLLNGSVILGHDNIVENFNSIMPGVRVSGCVKIGNRNLLGVGSIILQNLTIGNDVKIGAGSVLLVNPKDNNTYIGNPAKKLKY